MTKHISIISLYVILVVSVVLLFERDLINKESLTVDHLRNVGHILLFAIATYLLIYHSKIFSQKSFIIQFFFVIFFCIVLGIIIELIQNNIYTPLDAGDLARNVLGALFALVFFSPARKSIPKLKLNSIRMIILILIFIEIVPIYQLAITEQSFKANNIFKILEF